MEDRITKIARKIVAGGLGSEDERQLKRDIEKAKKKIEQQVMRHGVKEDLGRKEVRELKDKYNAYNRNIGKLIQEFDNWIEENLEMWIDGVR